MIRDRMDMLNQIADYLEHAEMLAEGVDELAAAVVVEDALGLKVETPTCDWRNKTHSRNCDCYGPRDTTYSRVVGRWWAS